MAIVERVIQWLRDICGYSLYDKNPIICVGFDGVIHSYRTGWKGIDVIPDPPVEGAIEWLQQFLPEPDAFGPTALYTGPIVQIYSSRSRCRRGRNAMKAYLIKHGLPAQYITDGLLKFPSKKPPAYLTIDDRAMTFQGIFPSKEQMMSFKPWNRKPRKPEPARFSSFTG